MAYRESRCGDRMLSDPEAEEMFALCDQSLGIVVKMVKVLWFKHLWTCLEETGKSG